MAVQLLWWPLLPFASFSCFIRAIKNAVTIRLRIVTAWGSQGSCEAYTTIYKAKLCSIATSIFQAAVPPVPPSYTKNGVGLTRT